MLLERKLLLKPLTHCMKKPFKILLLLLFAIVKLYAQDDTTIYELKLKTGSVLYCQFVAKEEGNYITIKKDDGGIRFLQWSEIETYKATAYKKNSAELDSIRKQEEIKKKYVNWNRCKIVLFNGDTVERWVEYAQDYSTKGPDYNGSILIANDKGEERKLGLEAYKELIVPGKEPARYITRSPENGKPDMFKVLVDGPCKLYCDRFKRDEGSGIGFGLGGPSVPGGPTAVTGPGPDFFNSEKDVNRYYLFYKGVWTKVRSKKGIDIDESFRGRCNEVFSEFPDMVQQIERGTFHTDNIKEIVEEFNQRLSHN